MQIVEVSLLQGKIQTMHKCEGSSRVDYDPYPYSR